MADLITFVTDTGQIIRGSVMGAFEDDLSGKNYVIYTDNSINETGNYNIYAASYDPDPVHRNLRRFFQASAWLNHMDSL